MTQEPEFTQYQEAAYKHGVEAYIRRGEIALRAENRSRLQEIKELTETKSGIVELLKERASRAVLIAEMAESWVQKEVEEGKRFDDIGLLRRLGTYQETARRALAELLRAIPDDKGILDITDILKGKQNDTD